MGTDIGEKVVDNMVSDGDGITSCTSESQDNVDILPP